MVLINKRLVVTIPTLKSADLIRELEQAGWTLRRTVGSHHIFVHATRPGHITVPHPKKDLGKGLVHKIRKQAGLK
jgi:predicted RNA binding protein YcfA (HicA-like mRNA interferase family)